MKQSQPHLQFALNMTADVTSHVVPYRYAMMTGCTTVGHVLWKTCMLLCLSSDLNPAIRRSGFKSQIFSQHVSLFIHKYIQPSCVQNNLMHFITSLLDIEHKI